MGLISRVSSRTYRKKKIQKMVKSKSKKEVSKTSTGAAVESVSALGGALSTLYSEYMKTTSTKLKLIDVYLLYILLTGIAQFIYVCLVGTFPYNSFLAGFISCVASFILGVNLRMQANPKNAIHFDQILPERAFADFIFAHIILHGVVMNFIG